jgi:hypothetical protein
LQGVGHDHEARRSGAASFRIKASPKCEPP